MPRLPSNTNLSLTNEPFYKDFQVQNQHGYLICEYLNTIMDVTSYAMKQYSKVFAFRIDLRFPQHWGRVTNPNEYLNKFLLSFKSRIHYDLLKKPHKSEVRYFWVKEYGDIIGRTHFHVAILLNGNAYDTLGNFNSKKNNLHWRIVESWWSALGKPSGDVAGLVHFPTKSTYKISRNDPSQLHAFIERTSYLAKANTKIYGNRYSGHNFGSSRK